MYSTAASSCHDIHQKNPKEEIATKDGIDLKMRVVVAMA